MPRRALVQASVRSCLVALALAAGLAAGASSASAQWVINEIHADPDATAGDANGDGTVSTTQDEFVEIVNDTGAAVDISGWTLSDGFGVRHVFPAGSVVADQCSVVVFAGGSPSGGFGGSLVQTSSTGILGFNNSGDSLALNDGVSDVATASYGSEGGDNQSLTLDPDIVGVPPRVKHTLATGSGGTLFSPGTAIDGSAFAGCPPPPAPWVINEIHADPDAFAGDANGDGTVSTTQDEFVEIVNNSGADVDISGWTLADGFGVRHTFPAGSVVADRCSVVVFAGGSPAGSFGNSLVQTASSGALGLNNGGDSVTLNDGAIDQAAASYGSEGGDNQSLTLDPDITGMPPYVKHSLATGSGGALYSPGTRIDSSGFGGCPTPAGPWVVNEIHADPASGSSGDANGDGVRDFSDDEFVEIVNNTAGPVDISGWTLADGVGVRHTFPAGTVVPSLCSVVVFGGGSPAGAFGGSLVQTASSGALGLNNSGDSVTLNDGAIDQATAGYGSEGGDNQSLTLDPDITGSPPYVKHSLAIGSGGALFSPGTRVDGLQFPGCPLVAGPWVINEVHADPASDLSGDANGDGVRDFSDDEFVEIVNNSGSAMDISGWTLADGFTVRHVFPAGSVILDQCSVLVFGGGSPTGAFGNSLVQTATTGALGLNNGGDALTLNNGATDVAMAGYGSEGGDNQSLTLDPDVTGVPPFVKHTLATGSGGTLFSPGTKIDGSQFDGCPVSAEIFEIQGAGAASPFDGLTVTTEENVVTCLAENGFFMQTPANRTDGDVDTSDGIFVFTGGPPAVDVGDLVDVTGEVAEFFGLTEFTGGPSITVTGIGTVPPAVQLDSAVPSPDPALPSCAIEYECYEGMLVEVANGFVAGANQEFGSDPFAEIHITAAGARPFREPGIEFPGIAGLPLWDGNPEVFELDPDKLGLPNQNIPAGSTFTAKGVIGFEFNHYELWPNELTVVEAPLPVPVRPRAANEMTIGSLNLFRLFDDVDDPPSVNATGQPRDDFVASTADYLLRRTKFAAHIVGVLDSPDILAVQEAEKIEVLQDLAADINALDPTVNYTAYLVEGNDVGTIDVGFLVRDRIQVGSVTQLGASELFTFDDPDSPLHDRPPLLLEGTCDGTFPIAVMVLHQRSLGGIETERVQRKRYEQAESVAQKVQAIQDADPEVNLVVAGDFNAFEFTDGYVDVAGIIKGDFDPMDSLVCSLAGVACADLVDPDLTDQVLEIDAGERYSFIFRETFGPVRSRGDSQVLDHAMTSSALDPLVTGYEYGRGNADAAEELLERDGSEPDAGPNDVFLRSSDHDGLVLYLFKDEDLDGIGDADDACLGTAIPESVPTRYLGVNRWALTDGDTVFDTTLPPGGGGGPGLSFTIEDTAGCSCEQIIDALGLGNGHVKFGCSTGAIEDWVALVGGDG